MKDVITVRLTHASINFRRLQPNRSSAGSADHPGRFPNYKNILAMVVAHEELIKNFRYQEKLMQTCIANCP